jgi:integrase
VPFLRWCITQREMPRLRISARPSTRLLPVSQRERLELIRRLAEDASLDLRDSIAALLVLLYAQPVTKVVTLTTSDITHDNGTLLIRLGDPPAPVPEPFAALLTRYLSSRPNQTTATNPASSLLFPGRRAGQPLHPTTLRLRLAAAGIPNITGRTAALRDLLLEAPAPVVASMLGYNSKRAEHTAAEAGATWKNYAPGDHTR